jgi:hypothetical protein
MDAALVTTIEKEADRSASALFGLACGYACYTWFASRAHEPVLGVEAVAAFVLGYLLSLRALRSIGPEQRKVPVPIFDVREVEPMAPVEGSLLGRVRPAAERPVAERPVAEEADAVAEAPVSLDEPLVETKAQVVEPPAIDPAEIFEDFGAADSSELELTDPVEAKIEAAEDSRVVHLFDPASMTGPEEMMARIDRHLEGQTSAAQSAEAAQALHEALAELRRSIR